MKKLISLSDETRFLPVTRVRLSHIRKEAVIQARSRDLKSQFPDLVKPFNNLEITLLISSKLITPGMLESEIKEVLNVVLQLPAAHRPGILSTLSSALRSKYSVTQKLLSLYWLSNNFVPIATSKKNVFSQWRAGLDRYHQLDPEIALQFLADACNVHSFVSDVYSSGPYNHKISKHWTPKRLDDPVNSDQYVLLEAVTTRLEQHRQLAANFPCIKSTCAEQTQKWAEKTIGVSSEHYQKWAGKTIWIRNEGCYNEREIGFLGRLLGRLLSLYETDSEFKPLYRKKIEDWISIYFETAFRQAEILTLFGKDEFTDTCKLKLVSLIDKYRKHEHGTWALEYFSTYFTTRFPELAPQLKSIIVQKKEFEKQVREWSRTRTRISTRSSDDNGEERPVRRRRSRQGIGSYQMMVS